MNSKNIFGLPIPVPGRCWSCGKGATEGTLGDTSKNILLNYGSSQHGQPTNKGNAMHDPQSEQWSRTRQVLT
jgi:hypothetical protein